MFYVNNMKRMKFKIVKFDSCSDCPEFPEPPSDDVFIKAKPILMDDDKFTEFHNNL